MSPAVPARRCRVLIIAGSDRRQYNCPGVDGKARALAWRAADRMPASWDVNVEDLGNVCGRARSQSCNACVSTAMALCVWPCNCYEANNKNEPDLMWDLDLYSRLDQADAWAIIGPVTTKGLAPAGSSPARQHQLDLNRDATFRPLKSAAKK